uniref:Si:dkey-97o5.1 n=1 Tax=Neogobius melanostomus TaxID=47308 RepID=A0A8C6WL66_9GOBI
MSQTNSSLLDEVVQWSQETCRQELKAVLPKLTSLHHESESWEDNIRILKIITDMFIPHICLSELEDECFSKVLPKAAAVFDSMVKEILDQVGGLSSQNTELCAFLRKILESMMQIIDSLSASVRHVGSFEEVPYLDAIRSLPTFVLKILKNTFQHCKDSEVVYCGRLSLVADLLQALFKAAFSLQKGLLEVLDRVSVDSSSSDEEVSDIVTVIHSLLDICSIISNLDIALHANTWKFLIKHSLKYHSLVEEHLRHEDICTALCENLLTSFKNCLEMAEQMQISGLQETAQTPELKLFQKSAKMCRFFGNTLVHYIKEFSIFMTKYCRCFYQLYLEITCKFPPSLSAPLLPPGLSEELNVAARIPLDALLFQLLPLRAFAEVVLQPDPKLVTEQELAQCLLLMSVIDQLASQPEDVQQLWCTGSQFSEEVQRLPLYDAVFTSFRRCSTERRVPVLLPGVMMNGQAQTLVTLHHHVCVHVCASVAALPPHFFTVLEQCLVQAVLQADTHTALLAIDIWCFTARYGTAELCLHHAFLVAQMVKTSATGSYQSSHLGLLLRRMAFLITPNHQMAFVDEFPPSVMENLTLWSHILLKAFSQEARCKIESSIIGLAQKRLSDWQNDDCKLGQVHTMNQVLLGLLVVTRGQTSTETHCAETVGKMITQIWFRMSPDQIKSYPMLQCTLELLLQISTVLVKNIQPQIIYQALLCVEAVASLKSVDELLLVALEFLSSLGKIFVPPDCQSQILPRLSGLFRMLLISPSWILQQHALEAFSQFAESTNHEEVISQSLCEEETKTVVVNYLSKTVKELEEGAARLERLKLETQVTHRFNEKLETDNGLINLPEEPDAEAEPRPKRPRQECSQEQDYRCHIETAENALKALQRLLEDKSDTYETPLWLESRLEDLHKLLSILTEAKHTT